MSACLNRMAMELLIASLILSVGIPCATGNGIFEILAFPSLLIPPCGGNFEAVCTVDSGDLTDSSVTITFIRLEDNVDVSTLPEFTVMMEAADGDFTASATLHSPEIALPSVSGTYQCVATSTSGAVVRANSTVIIDPSNIIRPNPNLIVTLSQDADGTFDFGCNSMVRTIGLNEPIVFRRIGMDASSNVELITVSGGVNLGLLLTIRNPLVTDSGIYECLFVSECGNTSVTTDIAIIPPPPDVTVPSDQNGFVGRTVELVCVVQSLFGSVANVMVTWQMVRDGVPITISSEGRFSTASLIVSETEIFHSLRINGTLESDTGSFTCSANNTGGFVSATVFVTITRDPPFITEFNGAIAQVQGGVGLFCRAQSGQSPATASSATASSATTIRIVRASDGLDVDNIDPRFTFSSFSLPPSTLIGVLDLVNGVKAFIDVYMCIVSNDQGMATANATINFTAPPPVIVSFPETQLMPRISGADDVEVFTCVARSLLINSSLATITWLGPDGGSADTLPFVSVNVMPVNDSDLVATLTINGGVVADSRNYTCVIENQCGSDSRVFEHLIEARLALDGERNVFFTNFTENSQDPALLSLQHLSRIIGNVSVCKLTLDLVGSPLNSVSEEKIFPTKNVDDELLTKSFTQRSITYQRPTAISYSDLMTIIQHQEYINLADEFTVSDRQVDWRLFDCDTGRILARATTHLFLMRVNDNAPVITFDITRGL